MTVSTAALQNFTVNQLVTLAYKRAGLLEVSQSATEPQLRIGRELLALVLSRMPNDGPAARVQGFMELTLVADQYVYDVDASVLDFLDPGMFIDAGETLDRADGEVVVRLIQQSDWQRLTSKSATGNPVMFYPHRVADTIQVYLWPIPDTSGATIRFRVHRALQGVADGNATVDLEPYWQMWIVLELGSHLAGALSVDGKSSVLAKDAAIEFSKARGQANHRGEERIYLDHPTSWSRR